jgi:asparaginyl-tRNA synthetase
LQKLGSDIKDGEDFGADDETMLTNSYDVPIFVDRYPAVIKSFYMPEDPNMPGYVLGNDLLAPEGYGEVIGGSQRIADYDLLKAKIEAHNYNMKDWQWYLDLRQYGSVPHSGFGYGLERLVSWICHLDHVRETIPFPRLLNRINP